MNTEDFQKVVGKLAEFMQYCQRLKPADPYLIVNRNSPILTEAAIKAAENCRLDVRKLELSADKPYKHFPEEFLGLLRKRTPRGGMGLFDYSDHPDWSLKELGARIELLFEVVEEVPISWAHSPGITLDMAVNGPLQFNYNALAEEAETMLQKLQDIWELHITAPSGADVRIGIPEIVKFETDCLIIPPNIYGKPGKFGNLPIGEVWAEKGTFIEVHDNETEKKATQHYPVKLTANGTWICDVCIGGYDGRINPEKPVTVEFKDGVTTDFKCDDPGPRSVLEEMLTTERRYGLQTVLEEVGIGLNEKARLTGNMLEDEKLRGTCHLALGNIRYHADMLVDKPTIKATYVSGATKEIMKNGVLV
ncbi:MAG: aminopeptidase [Candidatus Bathyarchaeota archaeon]|nr:MAG: aminopeptidase [Candidatus Bathyarchaeota archaeon]